jgi:hypothetical protein
MADLPQLVWQQADLKDKFKLFKQRLELYFKIKKINKKDEKSYYLLRALDDDALQVYNSWNLEETESQDYDNLIIQFESVLGEAVVNFRVARLQLHYMYQDKQESLDAFVTRCRKCALDCDFEKKELENRIIEQIIVSTPIEAFQKDLLGKDKTLTLDAALEMGRKYEATVFSADKLKSMGPEEVVKTSVDSVKTPATRKCQNCDKWHAPSREACPAKDSICHGCECVGHWRRCCRKSRQSRRRRSTSYGRRNSQRRHRSTDRRRYSGRRNSRSSSRGRTYGSRRTKTWENDGQHKHAQAIHCMDNSLDEEFIYDCIKVQVQSLDHQCGSQEDRTKAFVALQIHPNNGRRCRQILKAKVDTGAEGNTLPYRIFRNMYPNLVDEQGRPCLEDPGKVRLTAYNGSEIVCHGEIWLPCHFKGKDTHARFFVVDSPGPAIVGLPTCERMGIVSLHCSLISQQDNTNEGTTG